MINVMSVSMVDFQEQLLMTISAEKYSDPTNREKVIQATKEKGIKEILDNTTVDKINNKVSVKYLYKEEKLALLGENLYAPQQDILQTRCSNWHGSIHSRTGGERKLHQDQSFQSLPQLSSTPFCGLQLCCLIHQLIHQSKNDHRLLYAYRIWPQPQWGHSASGVVPSLRGILLHSDVMRPILCLA